MEDITQELTNLVARTLKVSPDQLRPEADLVTDLVPTRSPWSS